MAAAVVVASAMLLWLEGKVRNNVQRGEFPQSTSIAPRYAGENFFFTSFKLSLSVHPPSASSRSLETNQQVTDFGRGAVWRERASSASLWSEVMRKREREKGDDATPIFDSIPLYVAVESGSGDGKDDKK